MAEYNKFEGQRLGNPFTYVATGRFPIVGASVFPTYDEMIAFITSSTSTAYGGATVYVISDKDTSKNGAYEIRFKDLTLKEGALQYFIEGKSNLEAIKLVNVNEQGGIESGNIIYGFYREGTTFIEERTVDGEKKYYNGDTEVTNVTDEEKNSVLPYIVLNLTNGNKIFINAEAFQAVSDTFVSSGLYSTETKKLTLTKNDKTTVVIDLSEISIELKGEDTIENGNSEFVAVTVSKTENGINNLSSTLKIQNIADASTDTNGLATAHNVKEYVKGYVDNYDCGTFTLTDSTGQ